MLRNMRWTTIKPAKPPLTEKNLPDQTGKVFIVTGATNGIGKALATILYQHNARVYIAARSAERGADAIAEIQAAHPSSTGTLAFIPLRLDDLTTIKAAAAAFLAKETRLDVLFNNAGVMQPPKGSRSVQGHELQLATNVLGHHLFTSLLTDTLVATAASAPRNSVRVVWVSSSSADFAPVPAVDLSDMSFHGVEHTIDTYNRSKAGNVLQAVEYSRRMAGTGIVSVALNPGFMGTGLQKFMPKIAESMVRLMGGTPQQGAYTELFAGFDPSITKESIFVTPYGKAEEVRKDLLDPEFGRKYWEWCDEQVKAYQ